MLKLFRAFVVLFVVSRAGAIAQTAPKLDESSIREILSQQEQAWNHGDGAAFAKAFTDDSDFVNIRGDVFHGRAQIAARHAAILGGPFKGSHLSLTIRQFTLLASGVALIETDHELTSFPKLVPGIASTEPGVLRTHMKYVALKRDGEWRLLAAQNTAVLPPVKQESLPAQ